MSTPVRVGKPKKEKVSEVTKLSPFDVLNDLNKHILHSEIEVKDSGLNIYLLLMFIKNNNIGLHLANYLNENWKIDFYQMYLFVFFTFKKFNVSGVRWVKSEKGLKYDQAENIQRYYHCSYITALDYLRVLPDSEIEKINQMYKHGGKSDI